MRVSSRFRVVTANVVALIAVFLAHCSPKESFASKEEAEAWFHRTIVVGLQCEGLRDHNSAIVQVSLTGEQTAPRGARVVVRSATLTAKYDAGKTCTLEKKVHCDDSGKVQRIESVDRPC
jgi:hypothetical protein